MATAITLHRQHTLFLQRTTQKDRKKAVTPKKKKNIGLHSSPQGIITVNCLSRVFFSLCSPRTKTTSPYGGSLKHFAPLNWAITSHKTNETSERFVLPRGPQACTSSRAVSAHLSSHLIFPEDTNTCNTRWFPTCNHILTYPKAAAVPQPRGPPAVPYRPLYQTRVLQLS